MPSPWRSGTISRPGSTDYPRARTLLAFTVSGRTATGYERVTSVTFRLQRRNLGSSRWNTIRTRSVSHRSNRASTTFTDTIPSRPAGVQYRGQLEGNFGNAGNTDDFNTNVITLYPGGELASATINVSATQLLVKQTVNLSVTYSPSDAPNVTPTISRQSGGIWRTKARSATDTDKRDTAGSYNYRAYVTQSGRLGRNRTSSSKTVTWVLPSVRITASPRTANAGNAITFTIRPQNPGSGATYTLWRSAQNTTSSMRRLRSVTAPNFDETYNSAATWYYQVRMVAANGETYNSNIIRLQWTGVASYSVTLSEKTGNTNPRSGQGITLVANPSQNAPSGVWYQYLSRETVNQGTPDKLGSRTQGTELPRLGLTGPDVRYYTVEMWTARTGGRRLATSRRLTVTWRSPVDVTLSVSPSTRPDADTSITLNATPSNAPAGTIYYQFYWWNPNKQPRAGWDEISTRSTVRSRTRNGNPANTTIRYRVEMFTSRATTATYIASDETSVTWQALTPTVHLAASASRRTPTQSVVLHYSNSNPPDRWRYQLWSSDTGAAGSYRVRGGRTTNNSRTEGPYSAGTDKYYFLTLHDAPTGGNIVALSGTPIKVEWRNPDPSIGLNFRPLNPTGAVGAQPSSNQRIRLETDVEHAPSGAGVMFRTRASLLSGTWSNLIRTRVAANDPTREEPGIASGTRYYQAQLWSAISGGTLLDSAQVAVTWRSPAAPVITASISSNPTSPRAGVGVRLTGSLSGATATGYTFRERNDSADSWALLGSTNQSLDYVDFSGAGKVAGDTHDFQVTIRHSTGSTASGILTVTWATGGGGTPTPTTQLRWISDQPDHTIRGGDTVNIPLIGAQGGRPPYTYTLRRNSNIPNLTHTVTPRASATDGSSMGAITGTATPVYIGGWCFFKKCTDQAGTNIYDNFVVNQGLPPTPTVRLNVTAPSPPITAVKQYNIDAAITNDLTGFYRIRWQMELHHQQLVHHIHGQPAPGRWHPPDHKSRHPDSGSSS